MSTTSKPSEDHSGNAPDDDSTLADCPGRGPELTEDVEYEEVG